MPGMLIYKRASAVPYGLKSVTKVALSRRYCKYSWKSTPVRLYGYLWSGLTSILVALTFASVNFWPLESKTIKDIGYLGERVR